MVVLLFSAGFALVPFEAAHCCTRLSSALYSSSAAGALVHSGTLHHLAKLVQACLALWQTLHQGSPTPFCMGRAAAGRRMRALLRWLVCPPCLPRLNWDTPKRQPEQSRGKAELLSAIRFWQRRFTIFRKHINIPDKPPEKWTKILQECPNMSRSGQSGWSEWSGSYSISQSKKAVTDWLTNWPRVGNVYKVGSDTNGFIVEPPNTTTTKVIYDALLVFPFFLLTTWFDWLNPILFSQG